YALDVRLIDDCVLPVRPRTLVVSPRGGNIHHEALRHDESGVASIHGEIGPRAAYAIAECRVVPSDLPVQCSRVWIQKQLVRIETMTFVRRVRSMYTVAVELPRAHVRKVPMPDLVGIFGQFDALELAPSRPVEQAQLDLGGVG